mgnify:CR=1 FL=1
MIAQQNLPLRESPSEHLYHLEAMTSAEARRLWRRAIKAAWGDRCAYCNATPIDDKSLTIDHVKPKAHGGKDMTSNCIPACRHCNANKGSRDWISWFREQDFHSDWREIEIRHWLKTGEVLRQLPVNADENVLAS